MWLSFTFYKVAARHKTSNSLFSALTPFFLGKSQTHNSIKISWAIKQKVISVKKIKTDINWTLKRFRRIHESNLLIQSYDQKGIKVGHKKDLNFDH